MNRLISIVEVRLGLRLIAKQPILSPTIIMRSPRASVWR